MSLFRMMNTEHLEEVQFLPLLAGPQLAELVELGPGSSEGAKRGNLVGSCLSGSFRKLGEVEARPFQRLSRHIEWPLDSPC